MDGSWLPPPPGPLPALPPDRVELESDRPLCDMVGHTMETTGPSLVPQGLWWSPLDLRLGVWGTRWPQPLLRHRPFQEPRLASQVQKQGVLPLGWKELIQAQGFQFRTCQSQARGAAGCLQSFWKV